MANTTATAQARLQINGKEVVNSFDAIKNRIKDTRKEMNGLEQGTAAYARKEKDLAKLETRLSEITKRQTDIRKSAKLVVNQNGELVKSYANLTPFGGMLSRFGQQYDLIKKGINTNVVALGRLKVALMATGIGAIVVIFGSLITYLTGAQEGMDKITSVTRPLKAIFQAFLGVVQDLGKAGFDRLAAAIKNPKEALNDLWQFIKDQVIHRFEALGIVAKGIAQIFKGDFAEGARTVTDGALQMATGVEDVIDKMANAGKGVAGFISESVKAGQELDRMTKQIETMEIDLIKRRALLNVEYAKNKELAQVLRQDENVRVRAAQAAINAQNELLLLEQSFLDQKIAKMKLEQTLNDTSREDYKELATLEAERIQFEADAAKKRASAQSLLNTAEKQAEKDLQESLKTTRIESENSLQLELVNIRNLELEAIANHTKLKSDVVKAAMDAELAKRKELADKQIEIEKDQAEKTRQNTEQNFRARQQAAQSFANTFVNILGFLGSSEEKMAGFKKVSTLVQIALDTASAISSLTRNSEANTANAVTFGLAGVAQFASGIARITANMLSAKNILKKTPTPTAPKFQYGGIINGPSHKQGGINLVNNLTGQSMGEMEGGEAILTRAVGNRPDLRALVNYANMQAGGARIFEDGGQAPALSNSAQAGPQTTAPSSADFQQFTAAVARFENIVSMFPKEVYGKWVYTDFKRTEREFDNARGKKL
uniref:hypothetical protein n=1 Tax=Roseivirga sp. TaxID=1964215 RepID=UPI004055A6C4